MLAIAIILEIGIDLIDGQDIIHGLGSIHIDLTGIDMPIPTLILIIIGILQILGIELTVAETSMAVAV